MKKYYGDRRWKINFDVLNRSNKRLILKALVTATLNSITKKKEEIAKEIVVTLN